MNNIIKKYAQVPEGLDKHSPYWAQILRMMPFVDAILNEHFIGDKELNLQSAPYCIVGEKHNFNPGYFFIDNPIECEDCSNFAVMFMTHSIESFNKRLEDFVKHCDERHPVVGK